MGACEIIRIFMFSVANRTGHKFENISTIFL